MRTFGLFAFAATLLWLAACTAEYDVKPADDTVELPPSEELVPSVPGCLLYTSPSPRD